MIELKSSVPVKQETNVFQQTSLKNRAILGGDYNDLKYCMDKKDYDNAREILRAINRGYRKRVFTSEEMNYIISNWNNVMDAWDELD